MAEIASIFIAPAIELVKLVGAPITRQFKYLCCFTTNINNLKDEAKKLEDAAVGMQVQVDRAVEDVQVIVPQVTTWLANSKQIKDQKTAILGEEADVRSGCLKLAARFSLSRRAKKTADRMKELRHECKFDVISLPGPPAASEPIQLGKTCEFESRKQIEENIMAVLKDGHVSMIGISGMGGLGKTTMAKRIMNKVLTEQVFEETVIAVVGQQVDMPKIQLEIGGALCLNLKEETSDVVRVQKLHARLSGTKRILLVLDDVWEGIELQEFGIPCDSKGCTILITSRNRDALRTMDVQKEFGMKILSRDEAWFLFKQKVGTCMDDTELKSMAEEIVKECEGLPLALAAVGEALKGEKGPSAWRDALRQLRQSDPDIPYHIEKVYNKLKLSYNLLRSKQAKSLFLLCCLYPEDAYISVEELTYFGMGLGIFEGIRNLEEVRNRMSALINMLKSRSLLLDSEGSDDHVKMHDVVRDVCIFIAKREGYVGGTDCCWISSSEVLLEERTKLPTGLGIQNLCLLFLGRYYYPEEETFKFDSTFFEGIGNLKVLCIQNYESLTSVPLTHSLNNLKSLVLDSCLRLETIFVVEELVNLEILICRRCPLIEELPLEIKRSNHLKLLELTDCNNLQRIGQGIISSLFRLEELKILGSFKRWESEDRVERENAGIRELEALTNLRCLEIEIEDSALAVEEMYLSSKIKKFHIKFGRNHYAFPNRRYHRGMSLELERDFGNIANSVQLQRDAEYLKLSGNGANRVDLAKCQNIRWLDLSECETVKNIITTSMVDDVTALPASIEHLILDNLPKLDVIWDGPISSKSFHNLQSLSLSRLKALKQLWKNNSQNIYVAPLFTNLSSIDIEGCHRLCNLGYLAIAGKDCLPQLEELNIRKCKKMEQVFLWNKEDGTRNDSESKNYHCIKVFPKLCSVELQNLPNLATFLQGMGGIEFPLLTTLSIKKCPKLKSMGGNDNYGGSSADIDDDSSHLLGQPKKVLFGNLKELEIAHQWNPLYGHKVPLSLLNGLEVLIFSRLHGSTSLLSFSVAENLINLRLLHITNCDEMLKVIENNKEEVEEKGEMALLLPKLEELKLLGLHKLVSFCEWKCDIELPSLRDVDIRNCPDLRIFTMGCIAAAPNLENVKIDNYTESGGGTKNLNSVVQQYLAGVEVSFADLKILKLDRQKNPFMSYTYPSSIFRGLEVLKFCGIYGSTSLFSSSVAGNLVDLRVLKVVKCHEILKLIDDNKEEEEEEEEKVVTGTAQMPLILFPKLEKLKLRNLSKLVTFCNLKCDIELPSLRDLMITWCPVWRNFTMGGFTAVAPNLENVELNREDIGGGTKDLNSVVQQYMAGLEVYLANLEDLVVDHLWNPFSGNTFPLSLFKGLEVLKFCRIYGNTSLFPSSFAEDLVNLRVLYITDCDKILQVIEDNKEEVEEKVVHGTAGMPLILFPKLEKLSLQELPKLVTFCEWKCDVKLPSLREVFIGDCPVFRLFTIGFNAVAPNLEIVNIDFKEDIGGSIKDLNCVVQHYMKRWRECHGEEEEEEESTIDTSSSTSSEDRY